MDSLLPYVTAALVCEKVLEEKSGVLSVIRIADRLEIHVPPGVPKEQWPMAQMQTFLALKAGSVRGKFLVELTLIRPNGEKKQLPSFEAEFPETVDSGANFIMNLAIKPEQKGLHWFEVSFRGHPLTRFPLMLEVIEDVQVTT